MDNPVVLLNRFLLALCIWREARGETPRGRRLVGQVVFNRSRDKRWPNTIEGVILQPWQFSSFNKSDPNVALYPAQNDPSWPDCVAAADAVLDTSSTPFTNANHYHVAGLDPAWRDASKVVAVEGHHVFYAL